MFITTLIVVTYYVKDTQYYEISICFFKYFNNHIIMFPMYF